MENLSNFLGRKFYSNKFEEITAENSIHKSSLIGIFFTGSWCPPCESFALDLINVYQEANSKEKIFEILQVCNEKSEKEYRNSIYDNIPWLFIPYNDPVINVLVNEYKVNHLPMLVIINKDKYMLTDSGRKDVADLGLKACEKWYKLYRVQKERDQEMLNI